MTKIITLEGIEYNLVPIEQPTDDKPIPYERWVPQCNEEYCFISWDGVCSQVWDDHARDSAHYKNENVFPTDQAQEIADFQRAQRKLIRLIAYVRGDWRPDWDDDSQEKCALWMSYNEIGEIFASLQGAVKEHSSMLYFPIEKCQEVIALVTQEMTKEELRLVGLESNQ